MALHSKSWKGRRELTEDDVKEADTLCKRYLDRWKEELE